MPYYHGAPAGNLRHIFQLSYEGAWKSVSHVGYITSKTEVSVPRPDSRELSIVLVPSVNALQEVEVVGRKEQSYKNTSSFAGTQTETPIKELPQTISYVTKEVIDDQQLFKSSDVLRNISGVNGLQSPTSSWSQSLLPHVERVEVVKRPASILYDNADPGGVVNTVTKKPLDEHRKSIDFAMGSFNTFRVKSDFTGPMNEEKTLLYRLNLAYQNAQSFRVLITEVRSTP